MPDPIDCSRTSHASCQAYESEAESAPAPRERGSESKVAPRSPDFSYDCVNDCVSSLGVTTLVSSALVTLGCLAVPAACPVLVGSATGGVLGACDAACRELDAEP